ncbi:LysE family translocator [Nocardioides sp. LML1-1-1.1]|uniref:LysE family translocator n=1 Tax=Nocardioides sp. LML1-1-1.1 TaxID=3135248 RepID=UPI00343E1D43
MPSTSQLAAFAVASFLFIQVPGPSLLFTIGRALTVGRRDALLSVVGNGLGLVAQVVLVAVGLGAVVAASATAFTVLKIAGAAYVAYLGIQAIRHRGDARAALAASDAGGDAPARSGLASVRTGFLVGATNPKTIVFFVAFLPQFIDDGAAAAPQLLLLGVLFGVMAVCSDACWALVAGRARDWFARKPQRLDGLGAAGGGMMVGLGVTLVTAGNTH